MLEKGLFIVCEGLDCAGKTTAIKEALNYLNNFQYSKGLKTQTWIGKFSKLFPSTFSLLLELLYSDKTRIKQQLKEINIIQDRWYYSVLSHNRENLKDKFLERIFVLLLRKPDILVYFSVSLEERLRRLKKAEQTKDHIYLIQNPQKIQEKEERFMRYFDEFNGKKYIVDTTNNSAEETGKKLAELIRKP